MLVVAEPAPPALAHTCVEDLLADVPEGRVAEVMTERDRLGQILVEGERAGDVAGDARGLQRVRQTGAVVVALGRNEDLRLVLEAPEGLRVHDPVAVALERRAVIGVRLVDSSPRRIRARCQRGQRLALEPLHPLGKGSPSELRGHAASILAAL